VLRYAQAKGIPTFIHESNSFAGKSNILLGKKATRFSQPVMAWKSFSLLTGSFIQAIRCGKMW
jgi:UDP-N-acetylglucosamine:LPS N-acetylglucosamine transferase